MNTNARVTLASMIFLACTPLGAAHRGDTDTSASPHVKLRSVDMQEVRWNGGFWADRFDLCRRVMIPDMWNVMQLANNGASYRNFLIAAGREKGRFSGRDWSDGDFYKWLEGVAHVYAATHDKALDRQMDEVIGVIAKAQAPDGYISTQIQLTGKKRWEEPHHHELYNMGHLMTAAAIHYRATGKTNFLDIAKKLGDYLYTTFEPRPPALAHFGFDPSNIMGAAELYRATRDSRYLQLAGIFVDMRGSAKGGVDLNQDRIPLRKENEAVGHCVCGPYLYCGAADVYAETGEAALYNALERLWRNVTTQKMYVTGAIGAVHQGLSSRRDIVHEAFGANYQLPNRTGYNETCANIANAMWNWRMLGLTGEAKYADVMELVLYNSMLSGVGLSGKDFFYTNPLRRYGSEVPLLSNDSPQRWNRSSEPQASKSFCCPPNVLRTIAGLHEWAYSLSDNAVWVNLYGGNTLETERIKLTQVTEYPWKGEVKLTVRQAPAGEFSLMLRIPGWAAGAALKVNGKAADVALAPGKYAEVRRKWNASDTVDLTLPMEARRVESNPLVEETRGQVAVMRGPIVYCLESPDLPAGVRVWDVSIPQSVKLTPRFDKDLLGGVVVLEGEARAAQASDWSGLLYRTATTAGRAVSIRLIPYYAWANRGVSQMTVWLPVVF